MKKSKNTRSVGTSYEHIAGAILTCLGYEVMAYHYRCRRGEIDLIARDGKYLVFCEVKYRKNEACGLPSEAVDARKQRRISGCAAYYLMRNGLFDVPCRFDVISIDKHRVNILKNAFSYIGA